MKIIISISNLSIKFIQFNMKIICRYKVAEPYMLIKELWCKISTIKLNFQNFRFQLIVADGYRFQTNWKCTQICCCSYSTSKVNKCNFTYLLQKNKINLFVTCWHRSKFLWSSCLHSFLYMQMQNLFSSRILEFYKYCLKPTI